MFHAPLPQPELLKVVLQPLLEDFQFWFERTEALLEAEALPFLEETSQVGLLERIRTTRQEVSTAQTLLEATGGQAGIENSVLVPWHHLVLECWQVGLRVHGDRASQQPSLAGYSPSSGSPPFSRKQQS